MKSFIFPVLTIPLLGTQAFADDALINQFGRVYDVSYCSDTQVLDTGDVKPCVHYDQLNVKVVATSGSKAIVNFTFTDASGKDGPEQVRLVDQSAVKISCKGGDISIDRFLVSKSCPAVETSASPESPKVPLCSESEKVDFVIKIIKDNMRKDRKISFIDVEKTKITLNYTSTESLSSTGKHAECSAQISYELVIFPDSWKPSQSKAYRMAQVEKLNDKFSGTLKYEITESDDGAGFRARITNGINF